MTPEYQAALAKVNELPAWKPGVGNGDYLASPPYSPAPENTVRPDVPKGTVHTFQMEMEGSKFYPPTAGRGGGRGGAAGAAPGGAPAAPPTREVSIYIPAGYVPGTELPLLVCHDAMGLHDQVPAPYLPPIMDNMIFDKKLPAMLVVMVMPSSNRSVEYDTVSSKYGDYMEEEVLPRLEKDYKVKFTKDPNARAVLGGSSGGAAAMTMAWFPPDRYRRVFMYSSTLVSLRPGGDAPRGAWEFPDNFIPNAEKRPLRIWLHVSDRDNGAGGGGTNDWVWANIRMAAALKAKGYDYQFVFAKEAGHVDRPVRAMTLAPGLEWLWKDYKPAAK
jgi:iron(III)-enterobactin esterase